MVVGEVGVAIVRYFMCYVVAFQNPLRPKRSGEAYGTGSMIPGKLSADRLWAQILGPFWS
jgi:hypothetical protein